MSSPIEENVPVPPVDKPKKTRARRKAAEEIAAVNPAAKLAAALKFLLPAQKKIGPTGLQFANLCGHYACASDGIRTIATPIDEDLTACPHTHQFIEALSNVGSELAITQLSAQALSVASGRFRALVACVEPNEVPISAPDACIAVIDDRIKAALAAVGVLATDGAPDAIKAAVLLQANTAVATNGFALMEYWHGIDLPPGLLIPKLSAVAIAKADKKLTGFGFSQTSATFWYEDGSFIKTQLYGETFPNYSIFFNVEGLEARPLPDEFFKAVKAMEPFSENGVLYFANGTIHSSAREAQASTFKVEGIPESMGFNAKYLLSLEDHFKLAHFDQSNRKVVFFNAESTVRGVLMGVGQQEKPAEETYVKTWDGGEAAPGQVKPNFSLMDDDIPF
jgi:hypothetical protein